MSGGGRDGGTITAAEPTPEHLVNVKPLDVFNETLLGFACWVLTKITTCLSGILTEMTGHFVSTQWDV